MNLLEDLRAIWDSYGPQREADAMSERTRKNAECELQELNERRRAAGLSRLVPASEATGYQMQSMAQMHYQAPPRTWRDELASDLVGRIYREWSDK